jgi:formylglycine-generating enzyme required for sulfatase activity
MKTLKLAFLLGLTLAVSSRAQETRFFRISGPVATSITAFRTDGTMVWTNAPTNTTFTVQTATSLLGESNWVDYVQIPVTNGVNTNRLIDFNPPSGMVWIPSGTFVMGSPASEALRKSDEVQHTVTLTKGFYMGKYPVTQGQYLAVVGSNPSYFVTNNGYAQDLNRPVETVSWNDATNYCALLTQSDRVAGRIPFNWAYRLPTEAEREYACRAGTTTAFHFGSAIHGGMANFVSYYEYDAAIGNIYVASPIGYLGRTTTVGSYAPNAFGLYDMHGNVWEWCQDWYATGHVSYPYRVFRGGSWYYDGGDCRSAIRGYRDPTDRYDYVGFRVVLAPGQP